MRPRSIEAFEVTAASTATASVRPSPFAWASRIDPHSLTLADIKLAAAAIHGSVLVTECHHSGMLSRTHGCNIWLKCENQQSTSSFKERGALNRLRALSLAERRRGVITMSAGNHAQGVAYHAGRLGIPAQCVMPVCTPAVKVEKTRRLGAEVAVFGETLEEAGKFAREHARAHGMTLIHPYDDPLVIAGQGTIALEMLRAVPGLDTLVLPIGGGGLISGMAIAARSLKPDLRIIGVQAQLYPSMYNVIKGQELPTSGDTLAEGLRVLKAGSITTDIIHDLVDDIILVTEQQIEHAVATLYSLEQTVVEGAGAVGLAAVMADPQSFQGRHVGLVLTGGNIDMERIASIVARHDG
jgi:threonine dehydratase